MTTFGISQDDYLRKVVADREALLAALKDAVDYVLEYGSENGWPPTVEADHRRMMAAIAKAETP